MLLLLNKEVKTTLDSVDTTHLSLKKSAYTSNTLHAGPRSPWPGVPDGISNAARSYRLLHPQAPGLTKVYVRRRMQVSAPTTAQACVERVRDNVCVTEQHTHLYSTRLDATCVYVQMPSVEGTAVEHSRQQIRRRGSFEQWVCGPSYARNCNAEAKLCGVLGLSFCLVS
jgi:hypothetical protein